MCDDKPCKLELIKSIRSDLSETIKATNAVYESIIAKLYNNAGALLSVDDVKGILLKISESTWVYQFWGFFEHSKYYTPNCAKMKALMDAAREINYLELYDVLCEVLAEAVDNAINASNMENPNE